MNAFPLEQPSVSIRSLPEDADIAQYHRGENPEVRFQDGATFQFKTESPVKRALTTNSSKTVFTLERVEFFPKWRFEMKLENGGLGLPYLQVLIAAGGLMLIFTWP